VNKHSILAPEGRLPLLLVFLLACGINYYYGWGLALPFWLACAAIFFVYRDPVRVIPSIPLAIVSPVDGKVTDVSEVADPYLGRPSIRIRISMNLRGIFTSRSPVEGKVLEPPNLPDDAGAPHGVWLQTDEGDDVVMVMGKGRLNNTPRCDIRFGERVGQGQRCGFIHMGGEIELYLPATSQVVVSSGDRVYSGSDVIASLVHS